VDGRHRVAKRCAATSLDLDEGDGPVALDDEVDIPMPGLKATREDAPTARRKPALGDSLSHSSEGAGVRHERQTMS
jgi:hypothetical protein